MTKVKGTLTRREAKEELAAVQQRYERLLAKIEKARKKVDRRTRKLHALEARTLELERRLRDEGQARLGQAEAGNDGLRPVRLIVNPTSSAVDNDAGKIESIVKRLRAHGWVADLTLKTSGKAARELARDAVQAKEELVIVAAGDGTIEEVALQLVGSQTRLGIVPLGSSNNLARALGIPLEIEDAITLIGMGVSRCIDAGRLTVEGTGETSYFLETSGVGLTAIMVPAGQAVRSHRWSELSGFFKRLLDTGLDPISLELDDGQAIEARSQVVTVSNSPLAALNFLLAPNAKMDDGLLDVTVYEDMSRTDVLAYFMAASHGEPVEHPKVNRYQARRALLRSAQPIPAHSDKDALEPAKAFRFEVVPSALSVIAGHGLALTVPVEAVPSVPPLTGPQKDAGSDEGEAEAKDQSRKRRRKDDWRSGKKRKTGAAAR